MLDKIKLKNFKKFKEIEISFNKQRNILIGENGVGKSTILEAISLILSGSYSRIESLGVDSLLNVEAVSDFMKSDRSISKLPELIAELYFSDYDGPNPFLLNGKNNTDRTERFGLQLKILPNSEMFGMQIQELLLSESPTFPFDYYKVEFYSFANKSYSSFRKIHNLGFDVIDTSLLKQSYAIKRFVSQSFHSQATNSANEISQEFRKISDDFSKSLYDPDRYKFSDKEKYRLKIKTKSASQFEDILTVHKDNIEIDNMGLGERVLLSIEASLSIQNKTSNIVLIEEPENHLSYLNTKKLVDLIENNTNAKQTFIATHDNMIASRLNLRNVIMIGENKTANLNKLTPATADFFAKAPNSNVLNFILSKNVILLEGDAEYILLEKFYEMTKNKPAFQNDVAIISCSGLTFKRYLEIAKDMDKKVAVIRDNDGDYEKNIVKNYEDYISENIQLFSDCDDNRWTFEVCLYDVNNDFYETEFRKYCGISKKSVLEYMIGDKNKKSSKGHKSESAFSLLKMLESDTDFAKSYVIPDYINKAIEWIK
ncbi:ATP-dependent nuclease [Leuconostoc mesenteroides]|uniref:ATP-dependent nuclease n=1 Tax=Leuconostoc mesenteroides TaxID=1245 RepID=UPI0005A5D963|nr:AAA family ATPase [Leuconostoc mesenteroides]